MIANYHTHTWRCSHATDTEKDYVETAVQRGLKTLGFSDHSPYCFPDGYVSGFRMKPGQLPDYAATVLRLRDEYRAQMDIHLGVELEYYPTYFHDTVKLLRDHGVEYAILGQHFPGDEMGEKANASCTDDAERLKRYCHQVMEAMNTGLFTYVAHPDMFRFEGDPAVYRLHIRSLCREANVCGMPLEINLLGVTENRHYPRPLFWEIAAEEGCRAILGCDAHNAAALLDIPAEDRALALAKQVGIEVLDTVPLRHI